MDSSAQPTVGAAKRRRERRLRMHWGQALAAATHHSAQPRAKEGVEGETYDPPRRQKPPPGTRPASLAEPRGDVMQVQRHTVQQIADGAPCLPTLGVPVPQMVDQRVDILKIIAKLSPAVEEQAIDVPKIIQDPTPQRLEPSEPQQLVEQLVDVPWSRSSHRSWQRLEWVEVLVRIVPERWPNK